MTPALNGLDKCVWKRRRIFTLSTMKISTLHQSLELSFKIIVILSLGTHLIQYGDFVSQHCPKKQQLRKRNYFQELFIPIGVSLFKGASVFVKMKVQSLSL
jgi:hypothetical protein